MDIRPIRTETDYEWALTEIEAYFSIEPEPGTPEADRFDVLVDLIEAYESRNWPIEAPTPIEAIRSFMQMRGFTQADLANVLGSKSRASEVLRGERRLSLDMVHRISTAWHLPADILVRPYPLGKDAA